MKPRTSQAHTIAVDAATHADLMLAAYKRATAGEDVRDVMAGIVKEAFGLWQAMKYGVRLATDAEAAATTEGAFEAVMRAERKAEAIAAVNAALACDGSEECGCGECRDR